MRLDRVTSPALAFLVMFAGATLVSGQGSTPAGTHELVAEGRASYERGDYGDALLKFEEAVKQGASGGEIYYQMGFCYRTAREDLVTSKAYMEKAIPLLEQKLREPGGRDLKTYYYLAAIRLSDVPDQAKLSQVAGEAISAVETGSLPAPSRPQDHFLIGRLYGFQGKRDQAAASYEKAIDLIGPNPDPASRGIYLHCLQSAGQMAIEKQSWDRAADLFGKLSKADPSRPEAQMLHPLCLFRAGKELKAAEEWQASTLASMAEEKPYLARIARRYTQLGRPAVTAPASDQDLMTAIVGAARKFAETRAPDDKAAKAAADAWVQEQLEARKSLKRTDPNAVSPITWNPPIPDPSPDRVAAENSFFGLLAELVRRGRPVRDFAVTNGLAQIVFK